MGDLIVNGSVAGDIRISGGSLWGTGSCQGDLWVDEGGMNPGNSPGTFTVLGDYTQSSSSTYTLGNQVYLFFKHLKSQR